MAVSLQGTGGGEVSIGKNIANEARDTLTFSGVRLSVDGVGPLGKGVSRGALYRRGALARATMMSGALERAMDLAVNYAQDRVQFGRPISKFQAIQQNLAVLAGQTAAAVAAANLGIEALGKVDAERETFLIAIAKTRVGEAATLACEIAHQVHGAIGFTIEHILYRYSLRALAWRDDFGSESYWAVELGNLVAARGADELWPLVASR
jgi:acyl-CoA dehydrogenase